MKIQKNWLRILIVVAIIVLAALTIWLSMPRILELAGSVISLFLPFLLGYGFSLLVNPLANFLQKKLSIPRGFSAVLVIIFTIGIIGGGLFWGIFKIVEQIRELYTQFPYIYNSWQKTIRSFLESWEAVYSKLPLNIQYMLTEMGDVISEKAWVFVNDKSEPVVDGASRFAMAIPKAFVGVVVFILSSYFMIADSEGVSKSVNSLMSKKVRGRMAMVRNELKFYLGGYIKAQGILMCIAFFVMFLELSILRVRYALIIALGIAILDALPFFGSGFVLWPWSIASFATGNIKMGVGLVVVYISVALMRRFAEPKLISSKMGTNPILTLMSMYIGYRLLSLGGLILGPIIMMVGISFYKAGLFDGIILFVKLVYKFIKEQVIVLKDFFIKLTGSDWHE